MEHHNSIDNENPDYEFMFFLGCLRRCDYSASGDVRIERDIPLSILYEKVESNIRKKIGPQLWQEKLMGQVDGKSLALIAPTGSGKTEFSLLWAKNIGRKLIYSLPLRVALNDLFGRFEEYFPESDENLGLLHSTAFIEYVSEEKSGTETDIEKKLTSAGLLSYPAMLSTPDQIFLASLNYYGSDKVISVYPFSAFVLDEIQAYNPEMAAVIIKTLKIVRELGGAVLIMTATPPPYFEPFLNELGIKIVDTDEIKEEVKNYDLQRHRIKLVFEPLIEYSKEDSVFKINEGKLDEYIKKFEGKNVFIVLNNVSKAIEIYRNLKGKYPNVFLLHSRLIEKEKDRRIKLVKLLIKKNKSEKNLEEAKNLKLSDEVIEIDKPVIIVSTQVIEASVDLDFDVMITEISPIDSQIQRWGRIYRNRSENYNESLPNIVIFAGNLENGEIKIDKGTTAIYDKRVIEKTIEVLKEFEGKILCYKDERTMIGAVFNRELNEKGISSSEKKKTLKDTYIEEIKKNLDFLRYFSVEKRSEAQRLFRNIAGFQLIVPHVMQVFGDDVDRKIADIVDSLGEKNPTWDDVEELAGINRWAIKKRLYMYSVNVPVFYFDDLMKKGRIREFKGYFVLKIVDEEAGIIHEFGLDKFVVDRLKMENEENYIFRYHY